MVHASHATVFPTCRALLPEESWQQLITASEPRRLAEIAAANLARLGLPPFLPDLARLEWAIHMAGVDPDAARQPVAERQPNPTLHILEVAWQGLADVAAGQPSPRPGDERLLVWFSPSEGRVMARPATDEDLLALKMAVEGIDPQRVAAMGELPVGAVDGALARAVRQGLLLAPPSRIRRDATMFPVADVPEESLAASVFTLQWHITQACDLHCKHCYDRSARPPVSLQQGLAVLDDLRQFCLDRQVQCQVSFSGGNPLLHPDFFSLYRAAAERGFLTAILGNPTNKRTLEEIQAIQPLAFFQVSLEGLERHNDLIRGTGHFRRVFAFLELLREMNIYSMVMLTLTRDNLREVLPLAELLRDKVDLFTFNRLAMVGEGAQLLSVVPEEFPAFLDEYLAAAAKNGAMSLKDNLFNVLRHRQGLPLFGGCTGYGCGAAFNFLSVLPDGETHACRKFPSLIGNLHQQRLGDLYDSAAAQRYRAGSKACSDCPIRANCGGCLAVVHGFGLEISTAIDPYCFFAASEETVRP